ncbi:MAG: O-antigen ligase family protein [Patescibacteria group bacterium]
MKTRWILILLPLLLPAYVVRFHIGPLPTTLLEVALVVVLVAWAWMRRNELKKILREFTKSRWYWPLGLWLCAGAIGIAIASNHLAAFGLWRAYFIEPILVFIMLRDLVRTDKDKRDLLRSLSLVVATCAMYAIFQFVTHLGIPSPWGKPPQGIRATGPFPYPNALALFVVPAAVLFANLLIQKSKLVRQYWLWIGMISGLIAAVLAKSDGGLIAFTAAIFVILVLKKETRRYAITAAVIGSIVVLAVPQLRSIAEEQFLFKKWSGKVRLVMWGETKTMLADRPLFGAGLGNYPTAIVPYHKATWMEIFQYPHNILLNLWSETGLLGLVAFGWILFIWWREGKMMALPVITAIIVQGLVDVPYFKNDLAVMFWILVILTTTRIDEPGQVR